MVRSRLFACMGMLWRQGRHGEIVLNFPPSLPWPPQLRLFYASGILQPYCTAVLYSRILRQPYSMEAFISYYTIHICLVSKIISPQHFFQSPPHRPSCGNSASSSILPVPHQYCAVPTYGRVSRIRQSKPGWRGVSTHAKCSFGGIVCVVDTGQRARLPWFLNTATF